MESLASTVRTFIGWPIVLLYGLLVKLKWLTVEEVAIISYKYSWVVWAASTAISISTYYGIFATLKWTF